MGVRDGARVFVPASRSGDASSGKSGLARAFQEVLPQLKILFRT